MRPMTWLTCAALLVPAAALSAPRQGAIYLPKSTADCPRTTSHVAVFHGLRGAERLAPKKLAELPPARGYMAVYRQVGGCEMPLTVVSYRAHQRG